MNPRSTLKETGKKSLCSQTIEYRRKDSQQPSNYSLAFFVQKDDLKTNELWPRNVKPSFKLITRRKVRQSFKFFSRLFRLF